MSNTPLVQLNRCIGVDEKGAPPLARVLAKLEGGNPCFSSKARTTAAVITGVGSSTTATVPPGHGLHCTPPSLLLLSKQHALGREMCQP